jgi:hypothetical protein
LRRSRCAPDQTRRYGWELIGPEGAQHLWIKSSVPAEAQINIGSNLWMVTSDLVEQLGDKARDAADALDVPLSAHLCRVLRFWLRADN